MIAFVRSDVDLISISESNLQACCQHWRTVTKAVLTRVQIDLEVSSRHRAGGLYRPVSRPRRHRCALHHPSRDQVLLAISGDESKASLPLGISPQKNDPGFVDALSLRSRPIAPMASTALAFGA